MQSPDKHTKKSKIYTFNLVRLMELQCGSVYEI
jgi:hypothetical protein